MTGPLSEKELLDLTVETHRRNAGGPDSELDPYFHNVYRVLLELRQLRAEDRRWGERIKLLERRIRFAAFVLSGHGDHLLPEEPA